MELLGFLLKECSKYNNQRYKYYQITNTNKRLFKPRGKLTRTNVNRNTKAKINHVTTLKKASGRRQRAYWKNNRCDNIAISNKLDEIMKIQF